MTDALIGDIGGTNARFALVDDSGTPCHMRNLSVADQRDLTAAIEAYLAWVGAAARPRRAALSLAGPVTGDWVEMVNRPWAFSVRETKAALGLDQLTIINDFAAKAMSLPEFTQADLVPIGPPGAADSSPDGTREGAPRAVTGPGTGLGVSGWLPDGQGGGVPLSGEGGHATLAPADDREAALLALLRHRLGHVSAERVISGPGLVTLYKALAELDAVPLGGERLPTPEEITRAGVTGRRQGPVDAARAGETLDLFCAFLGTAAGNLTLTLGAWGGVYLAGGILPRMVERLKASAFRQRFTQKGRVSHLLEATPCWLIIHDNPAFPGLIRCLDRPAGVAVAA